MVNYNSKFVENISSILAPLYRLLKKKMPLKWGQAENKAFLKVKDILVQAPVLAHYNPEKLLTLTTDTSPYGVRAVLSRAE